MMNDVTFLYGGSLLAQIVLLLSDFFGFHAGFQAAWLFYSPVAGSAGESPADWGLSIKAFLGVTWKFQLITAYRDEPTVQGLSH